MLGSTPPSEASLERLVKAGEPLVIGPRRVFPHLNAAQIMFSMGPGRSAPIAALQPGACRLVSFTPREGEQYEIEIAVAPGKCEVTPYRLSLAEAGKVQREAVPAEPTPILNAGLGFACAN